MGIKPSDIPAAMRSRMIEKSSQPLSLASAIVPASKMNKTELLYCQRLTIQKNLREIRDWRPHPFSLKLAEDLHYRPDFLVVEADGTLTIVETKGAYIREDATVKFKAAKALLPFLRFRMDQYAGGAWKTIRELA